MFGVQIAFDRKFGKYNICNEEVQQVNVLLNG